MSEINAPTPRRRLGSSRGFGYYSLAGDVVLADGKNAPDVCHALFAKLDGAPGVTPRALMEPTSRSLTPLRATGGRPKSPCACEEAATCPWYARRTSCLY